MISYILIDSSCSQVWCFEDIILTPQETHVASLNLIRINMVEISSLLFWFEFLELPVRGTSTLERGTFVVCVSCCVLSRVSCCSTLACEHPCQNTEHLWYVCVVWFHVFLAAILQLICMYFTYSLSFCGRSWHSGQSCKSFQPTPTHPLSSHLTCPLSYIILY